MTRCLHTALLAAFAASLLFGCSDESSPDEEAPTDQTVTCDEGEYLNPLTNICTGQANDAGGGSDVADTNTTTIDTSNTEVDTTPDTAPDLPNDTAIDDGCDEDGDGVMSMACGGDDCDDDDFRRSPLREESCDELDNNCDGENNEGIECTFYAHTGDHLYKIDPFGKWARQISEVPNLFDIDTHPDGTLYGITGTKLFFFDEPRTQWIEIGEFDEIEQGTGLAIDSQGTAFITAGDSVYTVNLNTAATSFVGNLGNGFFSSGDCVVNKRDSLYMTSKADDMPDSLILIDRATGRGQAVGVISGFSKVFGLTAGWGKLYGLNTSGELISINPNTGEGTLLHTFADFRWYGAASTPSR